MHLNAISFLRVDERLTYTPDPADPQRTILKQEAFCGSKFANVHFSLRISVPQCLSTDCINGTFWYGMGN
ncbi:PRELI/MSF1 domain-containing protein [Aphelenchoides bicaudatus]|nr:PRELI/MSF1 domain-containing protein [Aphelenchoides bicaudatus]